MKKSGTIVLSIRGINDKENIQEELELEITQGELIEMGLDPMELGWHEKEKAKVSSIDIARLSKEKAVKKSFISQIASFFAKKKDDKEIFE